MKLHQKQEGLNIVFIHMSYDIMILDELYDLLLSHIKY